MSDVSQGPGWWLASDGKWYSPQQAPGPVPANLIPEGRPLGGTAVPPTIPVSAPGVAPSPLGVAPPSAPPGYGAPPTSGYGPPPGPPPGAPPYGAPPSPAGYGYGYSAGYGYLPTQKTNGLAVASLVCSLLWMFGLGSVLAVVFGTISLSQIKRSNDAQRGRGLAIAGVIVGILGFLGMAAIVLSVITIDHHCHQAGTCTFNTTANSVP